MNARSILHVIDKAEGYLSQILLVFFVTLVFTQTVLRSVFSVVIPWSEEASRFAFVWFVFFGASYAARLSAHNRVVIQFRLFKPVVGKVSMFITDILWVGFCCMMVRMSLIVIEDLHEFPYLSPSMSLSMAYVYWIFPVAFALMALRIIQVNYIRYILKEELADVDKIEAEKYEDLAEVEMMEAEKYERLASENAADEAAFEAASLRKEAS